MRVKNLNWSARVLSIEEYHSAKTQALECQREKKRFEQQRIAMKRCCTRRAARLAGVIFGSSVLPEHEEIERIHIKDMENEIRQLNSQVQTLLVDLEKSEEMINELTQQRDTAQESLERISDSWNFSVSQLDQKNEEYKELQNQLEDLNNINIEQEKEIVELDSLLFNAQQDIIFIEKRDDEIFELCETELTNNQNVFESLDNKIKIHEKNHEQISQSVTFNANIDLASASKEKLIENLNSKEEDLKNYKSLVNNMLGDLYEYSGVSESYGHVLNKIVEMLNSKETDDPSKPSD